MSDSNSIKDSISDLKDVIEAPSKRERKSVSRLGEMYDKELTEKENKSAPKSGTGVQLGNIERFSQLLKRGKIDQEILKIIHNICYRTVGVQSKRSRVIKVFSGFGDNEVDKRLNFIMKQKNTDLRSICDIFDVKSAEKDKNSLATSVLEFFKKPYSTDSLIYRTNKYRVKKKKKKTQDKAKKTKTVSKTTKSSAKHEEEDEEHSEESIDSISDIESEEKVVVVKRKASKVSESTTAKKRKIVSTDSDESHQEKPTPVKSKKTKGSGKNSSRQTLKPAVSDSDGDNNEEEASANKLQEKEKVEEEVCGTLPSDSELKPVIQEILRTADLGQVTLNSICDTIITRFSSSSPWTSEDRTHVKAFIRKIVSQKQNESSDQKQDESSDQKQDESPVKKQNESPGKKQDDSSKNSTDES